MTDLATSARDRKRRPAKTTENYQTLTVRLTNDVLDELEAERIRTHARSLAAVITKRLAEAVPVVEENPPKQFMRPDKRGGLIFASINRDLMRHRAQLAHENGVSGPDLAYNILRGNFSSDVAA